MKKYSNILKLLLIAGLGVSQSAKAQNPAPGNTPSGPVALVGGHIMVGNGQEIPNGTIAFDKGIITYVGPSSGFNATNVTRVNVAGKYIYPSLISPNSQAGLTEIEAVRTTHDYEEVGDFNPNVRSLIAYNTDSEVIPTIRGNGVLIGQTVPLGGYISGSSSVMYYDGWNWEDAVLKADDGIWLNWPSFLTTSFDMNTFSRTQKKNDKYNEQVAKIREYLANALAYKEVSNPTTFNAKYATLTGLYDGSRKLYINANDGKQIIEAVQLCKEMGIKNCVIVGATDADLAIDFLKMNQIPVLVAGTQRLPNRNDDDVWSAYQLPKKLVAEGLLVGMYYNASYWRTRNLGFNAGTAAAYGLSKAEALQMVTLNNAKILGIDKEVGSLEVGKHATIVVSEGDLLDMRAAKVTEAYIRGKAVDLDDKQKRLYRKYKDKYQIK